MAKAKDVGPFGSDRLAGQQGGTGVPGKIETYALALPTVGRIIQYRQKTGSQAWLPGIVTVTAETFVPGVWVTPEVDPRNREGYATIPTDGDGEVYLGSEIPPVKLNRVHVRIFSPIARDYYEFNVPQGIEPGCWRWPPVVG